MLFGGVGIAVVVVLIVVMSRGGGDASDANTTGANAAAKSSTAPPPTLTPAPSPAGATLAAKPGKTPARPAPPLSQALLDQCGTLLAEAKALSNEGVKLRLAGNNAEARAKQSAASDKLERIKELTATPWSWQEEAELGDWALAAEYVRLGALYTEVGKLENQVRKGGGTR